MYSSLCVCVCPPPSTPSVESCDCGHRGWPPPRCFSCRVETRVKRSLNYKYAYRVLSLCFLKNKIYSISCSILCDYVLAFALLQFPAGKMALLWTKLGMCSCCTLLQKSGKYPTKYLKVQHLLFSLSVSLSRCLPPLLFSFPPLSVKQIFSVYVTSERS